MISFSPGTWWISRRVWTLRLFWARDLTNWGLNRKMAPSCGSELKKKKITVTVLSAGSNPVSMCYPGTKRGFARDEGALLLRQKKKKRPHLSAGAMQAAHRSRAVGKDPPRSGREACGEFGGKGSAARSHSASQSPHPGSLESLHPFFGLGSLSKP